MPDNFGAMADGTPVDRVTITNGSLSANIISWGAVVQDLRLAGHPYPLVLGFEEFEHYPVHSPYFGAIAGRYANRIANGRFSLDGQEYQLDTNFLAKHLLHGGAKGIGKRNWTIEEVSDDWVTLTITDPDGSNGFPGNCAIQCTYRITNNDALEVELTATSDQPTICNLTNHSYFNLDGSGTILEHKLQINADHYLPVDDELIPTGEVKPVAGTEYDFREPVAVGARGRDAYDHNFCLTESPGEIREVARLCSDRSGIEMRVSTTEPGLQFYSGKKISIPLPGLNGASYSACAGLALEAQIWPDAPNNPAFPQAVLRPSQTYRHLTRYRFSRK